MLSKSFTSVCRDRPYGGKGGTVTFYEFVESCKKDAEEQHADCHEAHLDVVADRYAAQAAAYSLVLRNMPVSAASEEI